MARSGWFLWSGIVTFFVLYLFQAIVLVYYMSVHVSKGCGFVIIPYMFSIFYLFCSRQVHTQALAIREVAIVWFLYMVAFVPSVAVIFFKAVDNLHTSDTFGPNALKTALCITPVLFILMLNIAIAAGNQRFVERLCATAVLDHFDGIEMLEIILLEKLRSFYLPDSLKICIIIFVCISFFLSPFALFQHKVNLETAVLKTRKKTLIAYIILKALYLNVAFLVIRCIVWFNYNYDASIFITKNILSIVMSAIEIFAYFRCCGCGNNSSETFNV